MTYDPSSHSGSMRLPPPLTPGIHDFFCGAAATTASLLGPRPALPAAVGPGARRRDLLAVLGPERKGVDRPWSTTAEVEAMAQNFDCLIARVKMNG